LFQLSHILFPNLLLLSLNQLQASALPVWYITVYSFQFLWRPHQLDGVLDLLNFSAKLLGLAIYSLEIDQCDNLCWIFLCRASMIMFIRFEPIKSLQIQMLSSKMLAQPKIYCFYHSHWSQIYLQVFWVWKNFGLVQQTG
jgi:hypothetical protein